MDPREQLTQHLTPHGASLEMVGGRSTADMSEILSHMDFAHALGKIAPMQAAMLSAKYLDDAAEERKIREWWLAEVADVAMAKGWKPGWRLGRMADSTMSEHMGYGTRCEGCDGTRERVINKLPVLCPNCGGAGFLPYTPAHLALEIGCTMLEWDRWWRARVDWARRALYCLEADATEAVRPWLRDDY